MRKKDISDAIGNIMIDISKKLQIFREKRKGQGRVLFYKRALLPRLHLSCIYIICFDIGSCGFFSGL